MEAKRKALIVATVGRFLNFEKNDIQILKELGYEVYCASNFCVEDIDQVSHIDVSRCQVDFARSPFSVCNLKAYGQIKELLKNHSFELIHCHTPVGGILTRLAAKKYRKNGVKVLYTAHGFHFFNGAPLINWILYYPIEWLFSFWTDVLITINKEDYQRAQKSFRAKKIEYVPGVGIDLDKFKTGVIDREKKRQVLGVKKDETMLLSVGELSVRKNHAVVIRALEKLNKPKVKYFVCGTGNLQEKLEKLIHEKGLANQVFLLGFRNDISELCQCADVFVFPSLQEGLPVALMEAIACRIPVVCSNVRGNVDLIDDSNYLFEPSLEDDVKECLENVLYNLSESCTEQNFIALQKFKKENVSLIMKGIYENKE